MASRPGGCCRIQPCHAHSYSRRPGVEIPGTLCRAYTVTNEAEQGIRLPLATGLAVMEESEDGGKVSITILPLVSRIRASTHHEYSGHAAARYGAPKQIHKTTKSFKTSGFPPGSIPITCTGC